VPYFLNVFRLGSKTKLRNMMELELSHYIINKFALFSKSSSYTVDCLIIMTVNKGTDASTGHIYCQIHFS